MVQLPFKKQKTVDKKENKIIMNFVDNFTDNEEMVQVFAILKDLSIDYLCGDKVELAQYLIDNGIRVKTCIAMGLLEGK